MHVSADKRCKLDAKAIEVTLVGFEPGAKGYQLWDKSTHSVCLSRDVTFDESSFPSHKGVVETQPRPTIPVPVITMLNPAVGPLLPITRAPSPTQSQSSAEDVENLLDQSRPNTPPSTIVPFPPPNSPRTPKKECTTPTSPPPCEHNVHIKPETPLA